MWNSSKLIETVTTKRSVEVFWGYSTDFNLKRKKEQKKEEEEEDDDEEEEI
ncbi:hypothetical protein PJP12_29730 [Mycobacterium kansasii]